MNQQAVLEALTPVVEALGLEVDRFETAAAGKRTVVKVFLDGDGPEGRGPSLDEIAKATRAISAALDATPAVGTNPYVLEVSSRGVGRPLTDPKHFRRNLGRLVAFKLADATKPVGRLVEANTEGLRVDVDGAEREIAYADITKAVVQVELTKLPADDSDDSDADGVIEGE